MDTPQNTPDASREARFVISTIERCQQDKGLAAQLRRGDNPATEYQAWDWLAEHGIKLDYVSERLPFVTIASAIARARPEHNGKLAIGSAIALCYVGKDAAEQDKAHLRRLLACSELTEVCRILRPLLRLIESRVTQPLDYVTLLRQLHFFGIAAQQGDPDRLQRVKAKWAQSFYERRAEAEAAV